MRKFILAGILVLFTGSVAMSINPSKPTEIPHDAFRTVVVDPTVDPSVSKIVDPIFATPVPTLIKPQFTAKPIVVPIVTPKPTVKPPKVVTPIPASHTLSGIASWYCLPGVSVCTYTHPTGGYYAAIRRDLLELRGQRVLVCSGKNCVRVTIIDCNCGPNANLIDLYYDAFNAISDPSLGRVPVTISW